MTYRIVKFEETTGVLVVQFHESIPPFGIDLPLNEQGLYITGQELEQYIEGFAPRDFIDRKNKINQGIANASDIQALVDNTNNEETITLTEEEREAQKQYEQLQFDKRIAQTLIRFGVLTTDPTETQS
jgi:hypothetical protein